MKKTYKNPTTLVVILQPSSILTGSENIPTGNSYSTGNKVLSRRRNTLWDDEDEE